MSLMSCRTPLVSLSVKYSRCLLIPAMREYILSKNGLPGAITEHATFNRPVNDSNCFTVIFLDWPCLFRNPRHFFSFSSGKWASILMVSSSIPKNTSVVPHSVLCSTMGMPRTSHNFLKHFSFCWAPCWFKEIHKKSSSTWLIGPHPLLSAKNWTADEKASKTAHPDLIPIGKVASQNQSSPISFLMLVCYLGVLEPAYTHVPHPSSPAPTLGDKFESSSGVVNCVENVLKKVQILILKIDNVNIERVSEFNFLGLTLDEHLTCKCNINKLSNKISQCMGI